MTLRPFRSLLAISSLACILPLLAAQDKAGRNAPTDPALLPQRVLLNITFDPAHAQTVTWRTDKPVAAAQAQIAPASSNPTFEKSAQTVTATVHTAEVAPGKTVGEYSALFTALKPGTRYSYRVGDGAVWSEWFDFRTAQDHPAPFSFVYLGDAQNSIRSLWSRAVRAAYACAPDAKFFVHAGDLVAEGYDDSLWGEWFSALGFIGGSVPQFPVPGNHDMHFARGIDRILDTPPNWRLQFSLPHNGPQGISELDQQAYYVDYQGVRFIALNVNVWANEDFAPSEKKRIADAQAAWLEKVLADNPNRWTIVTQHQPIFTVSKERDYEEMIAALEPLYDKYHVDLVLEGHDHAYARTFPVVNRKRAENQSKGTVYVISVSGPKMYEPDGLFESLMAKQARHTQMYEVISVDSDHLAFKAYDLEGNLIDNFNIDKSPAAKK